VKQRLKIKVLAEVWRKWFVGVKEEVRSSMSDSSETFQDQLLAKLKLDAYLKQ